MPNESHWMLTLIGGGLVGAAAPYAVELGRYLYRRLGRGLLLGKWWEYHATYKNSMPLIDETKWSIRRGYRSPFKVLCEQSNAKVTYKGSIVYFGEYLDVTLTSTNRDGRVMLRYPKLVSWRSDQLCGLWLSVDHDNNIAAGSTVLSRKQLSQDEVLPLIKASIQSDGNLPLVRLRPQRRRRK